MSETYVLCSDAELALRAADGGKPVKIWGLTASVAGTIVEWFGVFAQAVKFQEELVGAV
jgi:hypothetical protein